MSKETFATAANPFARAKELLDRLAAAPHPYEFIISPWTDGAPPDLKDTRKRIETLDGYLEKYPDLVDAPRWTEERENLQTALAQSNTSAMMTHQKTNATAWLKDNGYGDAVLEELDEGVEDNMFRHKFTLKLTPEQARTIVHTMPHTKRMRCEQTEFDLSSFTQEEQADLIACTATLMRGVLVYIKVKLQKPKLTETIEKLQSPGSQLEDLAEAIDGKTLFRAMQDLNTTKYRPEQQDRYLRGISFPYIRAILIAEGYWHDDAKARQYLDTLNEFMAGYREVTEGSKAEIDIRTYFRELSDKPIAALANIPLPYNVDFSIQFDDTQKIQALNARHTDLLQKLKVFESNNDFKDHYASLREQWNIHNQELTAYTDDEERRKNESIESIVHSVRTLVADLHEKGMVVMDPEKDVKHDPENDSGSMMRISLTGTKTDIDTLQKTELFKNVMTRPGYSGGLIFAAITGSPEKYAHIPGVMESQPKRLRVKTTATPEPSTP